MIKYMLPAAAVLVCSTSAAFALEARVTKDTTSAPEKVWASVGDFCGIADWHPAVEKCVASTADGDEVRTLSLKGGGTIEEELISRSDDDMSYSYKILTSPLPVASYESTISVVPEGDGTSIVWVGTFDAKGASDEDAVKTISGIYQAGVDGIAAATKN